MDADVRASRGDGRVVARVAELNNRVRAANERVLDTQQQVATADPNGKSPIPRNRHSWGMSPAATFTTCFANRMAT